MLVVVVDVAVTELDRVHARIGGRFARSEPRSRAREYLLGLTAGLERENGWTLAERAGEVSPDGTQRLLRRADWDVDGVRDDLRDHVVEHLGAKDGVLIVDDTGLGPACCPRSPCCAGSGTTRARNRLYRAFRELGRVTAQAAAHQGVGRWR